MGETREFERRRWLPWTIGSGDWRGRGLDVDFVRRCIRDADRLAAIERDILNLADELDNDNVTLPTRSSGYTQGVENGLALADQQAARKLRAILDPPEE